MAGVPQLVAPFGALQPLDVRDPDVVLALADTVAILDADLRPRTILGRLGSRPRDSHGADDLTKRLADWIHPDDHAAVGERAACACRDEPGVDIDGERARPQRSSTVGTR